MRTGCALVVLVLSLGISAQPGDAGRQPHTPPQPDAISRLLASLETALASGDPNRLTALESPALAPDTVNGIAHSVVTGPDAVAVVRERARRATADGADLLADVFLAHGGRAQVGSWKIVLHRATDGRMLISGVDEQGTLEDLLKLTLDTTHEFAVHALAFRATDLTLTMDSGRAFLAKADDGVTSIVLHGKGLIRFAPPDHAEQGELQVFAHQSELVVDANDVFIRLNPGEFQSRLSEGALVPTSLKSDEAAAASQLFEEFAPKTYGVDLRDFGQQGWSFEPRMGNVVLEFKTGRFGWLTYARSAGELEDVTLFKRSTSKLISSYASAERLAARGRFYSDNANASYRLEHIDLDASLDPLSHLVRGHAILRVRILADAISSVTLQLSDDLQVSSVTAPGAERLLAVRISGQGRLLVSLPGSVPRDSVVSLDVTYAGRLRPTPFDREALVPIAPHRGEGSSQVGDEFQVPGEEFKPEPDPVWIYSGRTAWYPQPEPLNPATATLRLRVPAEYDVAASGTLVRESVDPPSASGLGDRTNEFVADRPVRYLACVISHLTLVGSGSAAVPALSPPVSTSPSDWAPGPAAINVNVLATRRAAGQGRALASRASDIVHFYASLIGEAPYPSFTVAALEDNLPGGHSPAYLTILRERLPTSSYSWRSDAVAFDGTPNFLLAHEIAHQWWGQAVGWKNYHEQWLSEGLAQYFAVLYSGSALGSSTMHDLLGAMRQTVLSKPTAGPISLGNRLGQLEGDPATFRIIVYNKSAVVLDMLRRLIGDKAFYAGLARFYRANRFASAGTDDFEKAFLPETPINLDRFFDTWILNAALPEARVVTSLDAGGRTATVRVDPVGSAADFPLTLTIQYVDGTTEDVTIPVVGAPMSQQIPLKGRARRVVTKDDVTLVRFRN